MHTERKLFAGAQLKKL